MSLLGRREERRPVLGDSTLLAVTTDAPCSSAVE
jgi:hypothetical protein